MDDMKRESRRAQQEAIHAGVEEIDAWRREERAKLDAARLSPTERARADLELLLELGRRYKRMEARAKRQNTVPKLMERDVREGRKPLDRYRPQPPR